MNSPWKVLAKLESDNSRLVKEAIIKEEATANNVEFFEGCNLALNTMITFGLKQIPEKSKSDSASLGGVPWESFKIALTGLISRKITGNAARDMVDTIMRNSTIEQWNGWYRRILIKDLRAGFSETTINKVVSKINPNFEIPVFSCQLAHDGANHESKVSGKKLIEIKLDGVRVITVVYPDGRVDMFSRNGKELANFPHIRSQFSAIARTLPCPTVFDGEIMSSSFQDLMKQVHRKSNIESSDAELYLFDWLPLSEFETGAGTVKQQERSAGLHKWFEDKMFLKLVNVKVVAQELVDLDSDAGKLRFKEINELAIARGYEGLLIKDPDAKYVCKRSVSWLKKKPVISVDLVVVDMEEGTGKNEGSLGALICEGTDQNRFIRVNVGSGLTDVQRNEMWNDKRAVIGQTVEILADAVTISQDVNAQYSLRFPRFMRFRDDK